MSKKPSPRGEEDKTPGVEEAFTERDEDEGGRVQPPLPFFLLLLHKGDEKVDHL